MYSDNMLSLYLDNYWDLYEGILPGGAGKTSLNHSPIEFVTVVKSDLDKAIDQLSKGKWDKAVEAMDAYSSDGLDPKNLFYDEPRYFSRLSKYQKAIAVYHLGINRKNKPGEYLIEDEFENAMNARRMMLRYLNHGISKHDWELATDLIKSMTFGKGEV